MKMGKGRILLTFHLLGVNQIQSFLPFTEKLLSGDLEKKGKKSCQGNGRIRARIDEHSKILKLASSNMF